ncbi:hypothetical protein KCP74_01970 [Salmonella enterica subsp. enterica]|nr:hypothetical protein KCP74_01970 [Salmonella enterica subsp. enterica]
MTRGTTPLSSRYLPIHRGYSAVMRHWTCVGVAPVGVHRIGKPAQQLPGVKRRTGADLHNVRSGDRRANDTETSPA